ncbi:MAG: pyridoxamine 5'-phosphate oxidase family protein [Candidatus Latescibacterota bacterium]
MPLLVALGVAAPLATGAQEAATAVSRDTLLAAAHELMAASTYCALITLDSLGGPVVRTMTPYPPDETMVVRFGSNRASRKAEQIRRNPRVCVYYANHTQAEGYVSIRGTARVVDDRDELMRRKREYWEGIPNWQEVMVLIEVQPEWIEVVNYKHGLTNDPVTWKAPAIRF